ncbi:hypothetical protein MTR67_026509 [Solanum verrucosum]|uniref:Uncharacterized protein n=1 Tax=Solanum verrucosum TaxID=315347 RepID=A0AAF0R7V6_SOLVR|nr:hypothetical protein MTR67_026509 [Solanum verrucosum]
MECLCPLFPIVVPNSLLNFGNISKKGIVTCVTLSTTFHPQTDGYHSSIDMALFEVLYGRRCRSPIGWFKVGKVSLIGHELLHESMEKVWVIREGLKTPQSQ